MFRLVLNALCAASLLLASAARADEPRTDGPEGSEIGKGGYTSVGGNGTLGLEVRWGAAAQATNTVDYSSKTPLFVGGVLSYWFWDWFLFDLEGNYHLGTKRISALIGPRFRTGLYPITLVLGAHAGLMMVHDVLARSDGTADPAATPHFGVSPNAGFELATTRNLIVGLHYALDVPIGIEGMCHRAYLNLGWRF